MKHAMILFAFAAALVGCDRAPEIHETNVSVEDVAAQVGGATINPGRWESKVMIDDVDIPGMPAATKERMKGAMTRQQNVTFDYCVSPDEAKRPGEKFFTGNDRANCRFERFDMAGGKIDAVMRCDAGQGGTMTMTRTGTYSADSYAASVAMNISGPGGGMSMKGRAEGRRVGPCTGDEENLKVEGAKR
ncbi:MAG TPA: DUF3617 domain-containing protein [Sphingomicrobium sp.]|nr:DUF3617 domain-containing protein [Sphingomicrobium sp.]